MESEAEAALQEENESLKKEVQALLQARERAKEKVRVLHQTMNLLFRLTNIVIS